MPANNYYEKLNFSSGKKINVSKKIDLNFSGTMHWHPYIEILVSLNDNNEVTVNFIEHVLKTNDLVIIYPGDLHSLGNVSEDAFILVQFPLAYSGKSAHPFQRNGALFHLKLSGAQLVD